MTESASALYRWDVIAVNINTGAERVLAEDKTEASAEAIIKAAVMRRDVDDEFYKLRMRTW
jgi:hypothetical protein